MKRKVLSYLLCLGLLLANAQGISIRAVGERGAGDWKLSNIELTHTAVSFQVSGTEGAQQAVLVIKEVPDSNSGETEKVLYQIPFSIGVVGGKISVDIPEGKYLPAGVSYRISVKDARGNETPSHIKYLGVHTYWPVFDLYPNYGRITNQNAASYHVSATIGREEYPVDIEPDSSVIIEYPKQKTGTMILMKWWDDYGCADQRVEEVKNETFYMPSFEVRRDHIKLLYTGLDADKRMGADIEGKTYYSEYGASLAEGGKIITFPVTSDETATIKVWMESTNGSKSPEKEYEVESCPLSRCSVACTAYLTKAVGTIEQAEAEEAVITKVKTRIDGKEYSCDVADDGSFALTYPKRDENSKITILCVDVHGCQYELPIEVKSEGGSSPADGGNSSNTAKRTYEILADVRTSSLVGRITGTTNPSKVYVKADGKEYECKVKAVQDETTSPYRYFDFSALFSKQKVGQTVEVVIRDNDGCTCSRKFVIGSVKPKLKVEKIGVSTAEVTGVTVAKSDVAVKVGNKNYRGKAKGNGKFSVKIKPGKKGTKVKVSVITPEGYTGEKTLKITGASGFVTLASNMLRTSTKAKVTVKGGKRGDKVRIAVGKKSYTKKLNKDKKQQTVSFKIKKTAAGKKVQVSLYDKFGARKDSDSDIVYYGKDISVGMSVENVVLTTWGSPVRKYNWGTSSQWVFQSGATILYAHIKGGKVTDIQKVNV